MDSADRIEAGATAQAKADADVAEGRGPVNCNHVLRALGQPNPRTCLRCRLGPCPFYQDDPTPPIEQSGLAGELQTLAINVNADIPDEGTRNRYVSALLAAATALTADKARDEALEEVRRLEDENRDLRREQIALVEAAGGELKVPHEVLNDLPSLELIKCRFPEDMTVRYKTRSLKGAAK